MNPIRCIECYKHRPGGRCQFCPLHKKNRPNYRSIGDGWFVKVDESNLSSNKNGKSNEIESND
ncbi:hypothetical protein [Hazenella coriacea]|uniref:Uncharacterized protein n=1 Tax=Hazenella coriacea TaxID=1179467 RepID=A0A4R3LCJ4_9BACL|nr:hypothetical protein [Hazenella coriacea]TCS97028.1 hypothetical protein EDD58_101675 [Hazenella coriacea]